MDAMDWSRRAVQADDGVTADGWSARRAVTLDLVWLQRRQLAL